VKRLAPGLYDDEQGGLHVAVGELLRAHGYADTPANRDHFACVAQEQIEEQSGLPVTVTTDPIGDPSEDA
jgi:hypothetical protein